MLRRLGSFFLLSLALDIAPGPDIIFTFAQALTNGWQAGVLVTAGLCTGLVFHVSLAAFGIAAVLRRCPRAFLVVTWLGAAYLVYLGVGAWRSADTVSLGATAVQPLAPLRLYGRGVIMNVCNPKVMLFFLALMPRFIVPERGRVAAQFMALGLVFALSTALVFSLVSVGGGAIASLVRGEPQSMVVLQRFSALVMFGLAGWIAWMNRRSR